MRSDHLARSSHLLIALVGAFLFSGCGGSSGSTSAAAAIEKHLVAKEEFGVMLGDIRTGADFAKAKPELLRQAGAIVDSFEAMNSAVFENEKLAEAEKTALIEKYQMRLAAADRLWREEAQRIAGSLGDNVFDEIGEILSKAR